MEQKNNGNIIKLETGKVFKNYKELCTFMDWSVKGGNGKISDLKKLDTICKWHKDGNKIIIDEVHKKAKEKEDGRNKRSADYMPNIENVILGELVSKQNKDRVLIGKSALLKECSLINDNFTVGKNRIKKTSIYTQTDLRIVDEYFDLSYRSLINDVDKALKNLVRKSLIDVNVVTMICKVESTINGYDRNLIIDKFDEEVEEIIGTMDTKLKCEVATEEERQIILNAKKVALNMMNFTDIKYVYSSGKVKEYFDIVKKIIIADIPNFKSFFNGYDIVMLYNECIKELQRRGYSDWLKENKIEQKQIINNGVQKKLLNNAKNRQKKAIKEGATNPKHNKHYRTNSNYLAETEKLNKTFINSTSRNVSAEIKKVKIQQISLF